MEFFIFTVVADEQLDLRSSLICADINRLFYQMLQSHLEVNWYYAVSAHCVLHIVLFVRAY